MFCRFVIGIRAIFTILLYHRFVAGQFFCKSTPHNHFFPQLYLGQYKKKMDGSGGFFSCCLFIVRRQEWPMCAMNVQQNDIKC